LIGWMVGFSRISCKGMHNVIVPVMACQGLLQ